MEPFPTDVWPLFLQGQMLVVHRIQLVAHVVINHLTTQIEYNLFVKGGYNFKYSM